MMAASLAKELCPLSFERFAAAGVILVLVLGIGSTRVEAQLRINEVMSSNGSTIVDEDGQARDWFEVYNGGAESVDLAGYGVSDGVNPLEWVFPSTVVPPGGHLLIFASGKDRSDVAAHWETVIDWGDEWKYIIPAVEPSSAWRTYGFDDTSWSSGRTGIGYGDGDDRTAVPAGTISVYARKTFQIDDVAAVSHVFFDIDFDDAFVAFINGVEIARENIADQGRPPARTETADTYTEPQMTTGGKPFHYVLPDPQSLLRDGENVLAIQLHNHGSGSSDLTLIPFLSLGMEEPPANARGAAELLSANFPRLHTSFKIAADGETLTLADPAGDVVDFFVVRSLPADVSQGRYPDGADSFSYYEVSTPGEPNAAAGFDSISSHAGFSDLGGFYPGPITIALSTPIPGESIYYTLDGSEPTTSSTRYGSPVTIDETTVMRARVLDDGAIPRQTITHTFFVGDAFSLPVVSISTDPENFFDNDTGIYVFGDSYESSFPHFGANFWEDWERPVHLELFEADRTLGFSADAGAKIFGGWSRGHPQRSLAFFARRRYGDGKFDYQIFPQKSIESYEAFVLRNSGNDWQRSHFRDAMMTSLLEDLEVDRQAYRPAIVFINGDYWGIMNLREKVNEHFIEANHEAADAQQIDLLERNGSAIHGDTDHYNALIDLVSSSNVSDPSVYSQVKRMMDVDNYIDYQGSQIYFDNTDWPGNNIKYWRPRTAEGRWRWIMFDTDFGFGIWNGNNYVNNTLSFALEPNGPNWPNPPWSTLLLRRLVTNEEFVEDFVNRLATHLNTLFKAQRVNARINAMAAALEPEMPGQRSRWGGTMSAWRSNVQVMRNFANNRVAYMRSHLRSRFGLGITSTLHLEVTTPGYGVIEVQGVEIEENPYTGVYFQDLPIRLTAQPRPGYRFVGWSGVSPLNEAEVSLVLTSSSREVSATFEIDCDSVSDVVINEVNYNAPVNADPGDWVELYNPTLTRVDLSSWTFRDESESHVFTLPDDTVLPARGYLVLCSDRSAFTAMFPGVANCLGDLGYALAGGGELLQLLDGEGNLVDSVLYGDDDPWPSAPDGTGATLALKNPVLDNTYAPHWAASSAGGTPGAVNDVFEVVEANCEGGGVRFVRGDCNGDGRIGISDARCALSWLTGGRSLDCLTAADPNGDASVDVSDAIHLLNYLFQEGPPPVEPYPLCGPLDDDDTLGCEATAGRC